MTVYVDHIDQDANHSANGDAVSAPDLVWSRLWADTATEAADFAGRLGITWHGTARTVISEPRRRRAILMGAIPVRTHRSVTHDEFAGVAA